MNNIIKWAKLEKPRGKYRYIATWTFKTYSFYNYFSTQKDLFEYFKDWTSTTGNKYIFARTDK